MPKFKGGQNSLNIKKSVKYKYTTFRKWTKTHRWYVINKKVSWSWYFEDWVFEREVETVTPKPF